MNIFNPWHLIVFLPVLLTLLCIYLLPAIIASFRKHRRASLIWSVNVFAGWTVAGWIVVMIWACTGEKESAIALPAIPVNMHRAAKYEIRGVDRESGMDVRMFVDAEGEESARVKADLRGVSVTSVVPAH